ncbi:ExbD/TolR family protein [Colwellia psychrerythraea]|uniref:Biopolymer transport protein ExbD/TolR n=1 Tax=Colwellia psychrerythraea TaxID=28229 RepID=A0A099KWY1_COLPS|nr:biopolymer transporter ExbD [Colwellia psychrerythraea]KGJ94392.1 Biopolymer transport protein ExbD/TolR [Colwellia psychrerythraea]
MRPNLQQRIDNKVQQIDLSPLLDVVFILLIFFIVTTVFVKETGVEVKKPQAMSAADLERKSILIAITEDGRVVYAGQDIGIAGVKPTVSQLLAQRSMPVILQVDENVTTKTLVAVMDEAKIAGATSVNLATLMQ